MLELLSPTEVNFMGLRRCFFHLAGGLVCVSVFFFASRRRHTRCLSDWSSDVCSSDLLRLGVAPGSHAQTKALSEGCVIGALVDDWPADARGQEREGLLALAAGTRKLWAVDRKSVV